MRKAAGILLVSPVPALCFLGDVVKHGILYAIFLRVGMALLTVSTVIGIRLLIFPPKP